ncbi:hypothetical protein P3X46_021526 [Hevea brasiliensis]|uniref:Pectinesterase inhibitor domain-containing protein n=1 Tax=Hevea brasiliensis TaxID=3981 RepID=A0ABQ9LFV3_HEVBR|nr:hypothetical protein P3X46_021526 [Hevea brasiliensis]
MDSQSFIRVFIPIFLCLFFHCFPCQAEAIVKPTTDSILSNICQRSNDINLCIQTLKSDSRKPSITDLVNTANIALENAIKESTATTSFFNSLQVSDGDQKKMEAIKDCARLFQETEGMLNLRGLDGDTASLDVHYALDNAVNCENLLTQPNVQIASIPLAIKKWKDSYSVAYAGVVAIENALLHFPYAN